MESIPFKVWMLDDHTDKISLLKYPLKDNLIAEMQPDIIKQYFNDKPIPDLFVLDICFNAQETMFVQDTELTVEKLTNIANNVTGIKFLTWLRCEWPRLPVVMISSFWNDQLPSLVQHAVCVIKKPETLVYNKISEILKVAQSTIIGVRLPLQFKEQAVLSINIINSIQNHFYFVLCENENDLVKPPNELFSLELFINKPILLFEVWNNRILGLIEDEYFKGENSSNHEFYPILPFSRNPLTHFSIRLSNDVEFMGDQYFKPYFLRECARAAYQLYFDIRLHPIATGGCLFDSSTYSPDLLKGIKKGEICPVCRGQMIPRHALGGWSNGRDLSANKICELAKEALEKIKE